MKGLWNIPPIYDPANVGITGGTIDGTVIGGSSAAAVTGTTVTGTTSLVSPLLITDQIRWGQATQDVYVVRATTNSIRWAANSLTTTSRTELNKTVAAIANAVATDVLTITIPNAAHSASLLVRVTCSLGAGGAIGANEATATNTYIIALTRTAGVNAAAAISATSGAAATAVAGAATVTGTAAMSAVVGAVGATNTFTVQATVSRSGGSSDNHTCLVYAQLMNANATGITIA